MINAGIGETHLNVVLTAMNIPHINQGTLKKRERECGVVIESVARAACAEFSHKEYDALKEKRYNYTTAIKTHKKTFVLTFIIYNLPLFLYYGMYSHEE